MHLERHVGEQMFRLIRQAVATSGVLATPTSDCQPDQVKLGARIEGRPAIPGSTTERDDILLRDRLFEELQQLRRSPGERGTQRIRELEERLNALLEPNER